MCPGLNNVIRSLYLQLHYHYGVPAVLGIRYGYSGFAPEAPAPPLWLNAEMVNNIHQRGGTLLGTSRGPVSPDIIVDFLEQRGINILFAVGGDGTQRGAHGIAEEVQRRKLKISVIGIPKTIDDDVQYVNRSFGYFTAIEKAKDVIDSRARRSALRAQRHQHREGHGPRLRLHRRRRDAGQPGSELHAGSRGALQARRRGRTAGGAASPPAGAASRGDRGRRRRGPAPDAAVRGARRLGQPDASRYRTVPAAQDRDHFAAQRFPVIIRYFDPSYYIRSVPASTVDSVLCDSFARHAVHAAMAGKTDMIVGLQHGVFIHVPIPMATT